MSDIFKKQAFVTSCDTVKIPDIEFPTPLSQGQQEEPSLYGDGNEIPKDFDEKSIQEQVYPVREPMVKTVYETVYIEPDPVTRDTIEQLYSDDLKALIKDTTEQAYADAHSQAYAKAYSDAIDEKREQLQASLNDIDELLSNLQTAQQVFVQKYFEELKSLSIEIAEKIILEKINEDDMILQNLVLQAVNSVKRANWISVEISEKLEKLINYLKIELAKPQYGANIDVIPADVPIDTCRVSTETGTMVASVSSQSNNLRKIFERAEA